jgi:hypothetical protein
MSRLHARVAALEAFKEKEIDHLQGGIDVLPGQRPIDALQSAGPGYWMLHIPEGDTVAVGRVSRNGKREVMYGPGAGATP